jgi:hypothetical protein
MGINEKTNRGNSMNISIFQDVTTEESLLALEKSAETYENLYVEMDQPEQRKFVKEQAAHIIGVLKKLDRVRIDKSRDYKVMVEAEAGLIKARLEGANKPFTDLIDEYKIVREKELAKQKAREAAKQLLIQFPIDHADGLLMNKMFDFEKAEAIREDQKRIDLIAAQAIKDAEQRLIDQAEQAKIDQEKAIKDEADQWEAERLSDQAEVDRRKADEEHCRKRNIEAVACFEKGGLSHKDSILAVRLIAAKRIDYIDINY